MYYTAEDLKYFIKFIKDWEISSLQSKVKNLSDQKLFHVSVHWRLTIECRVRVSNGKKIFFGLFISFKLPNVQLDKL